MKLDISQKQYIEQIKALRKSKKLHTYVEDRLIELITRIAPEYHPIKEPVGLAGGRNDLMLFEFNQRKILFEIFASRSQVSRDLRILDKTQANQKIAIIIDKEADKTVLEQFLKENPEDNYPFLFVGELFREPTIDCELKLRELIAGDEEAKFQRMLRGKMGPINFFNICRKEGIEVLAKGDKDITYVKIFVTVALGKCLNFGIARSKVKKLGKWLSDEQVIKYILLRIDLGLNMFLYTDFEETMAVYSDTELVDWIRIGFNFAQPYVFLSLNAIVYEIEDKYLNPMGESDPNREIRITIGSSQMHKTTDGRVMIYFLPKDTKSIVMVPPIEDDQTPDKYLDIMQFSTPDKNIEIS